MQQSKQTQLENRAVVAVAILGIALTLLDILSITPGWAAKFAPLMLGVVLLVLVSQRTQLDRRKLILRRIKRVAGDLRTDSRKVSKRPEKKNIRGRPETYRQIKWKGLTFRSNSEVKIAKTLDHMGVLFLASSKVRLKADRGRQSREIDFLICHQGRWGILEVDGPHHSAEADRWRDSRFNEHGIQVFRFDSERCYREPKEVVQDFLTHLENAALAMSDGSKEVFVVEILDTPESQGDTVS